MTLQQVSVTTVLAGLVLVVAAIVWPSFHKPSTEWTDEDARVYEETVVRVHEGAHLEARTRGPVRMHGGKPVDPARLAQHRQDVEALEGLKNRLENALQRPRRIAGVLKWSGAGLVVVGAVMLLGARSREQ
jgi:hypothetical protein